MAARAIGLATVLSMAVFLQQVIHAHGAAVHKVGDSAGWTTIGSPDYKQWAATKSFQVGDIVHKACNASSPLATFTTGNDSVSISTRGHHYFICGVNGHCQSGQKVDINVFRSSSPAPSSMAAAQTPAQSPDHSANSASSTFTFMALTQAAAISLAFTILASA